MRAALAAVLATASLGAAAPASATIVFEKSPFRPTVWAAADDGSARVKLASGELPKISPDGTTVAYETTYSGSTRPTLRVIPAAGGTSRLLLKPVWFSFAFSPDSKTIAAVTGKEVGQERLVLIDVAGGTVRTIAHGQFSGFSFSPDSARLVYARAPKDAYPPHSDLLTVAVSGGASTPLTTNHRSVDPVWGAPGIAFVKLRKPTRTGDAYEQDIYLSDGATGVIRRITTTKVPFLLSGLDPVSCVGRRHAPARRVRRSGHELRRNRRPRDREGQARRSRLGRHRRLRPLRRRLDDPRHNGRLRPRRPPRRDDPVHGRHPDRPRPHGVQPGLDALISD